MIVETTKKYLMQSLEWFEKNAFKDMDGEFWETEKLRDQYNKGEEYEIPWNNEDLEPAIPAKICGGIWIIDTEKKMWGVKIVLTVEEYPEYFI